MSATGRPGELDAMRRAIAISALGVGSASPNPPVGCVVLDRHGRPAGEGFHERKGEAHAEVNALRAAGARAAGGTAVVTLEPCNHHGRTPPCHGALIDAGIARVVVAVIDPTSRGVGGVSRLRQAGVDVEVGVLADEAMVVLGHWWEALASSRPHLLWAYAWGPGGPHPMSDETVSRTALRCGIDAVVLADGSVEEGRPGVHGPGAFDLPATVRTDTPVDALAALHEGGARSVLLHGGPSLAAPFLDRQLVDELAVLLPASAPSAPPSEAGAPFLPPGFRLRSVTALGDGVLLHAFRA